MPDHRVIRGKYFVLRPVDQIHGVVVKVVTEERRQHDDRSPKIFAKGFYLLYINEHDDEMRPDDELTTVILDDNIIPKVELTGENSVEGKKIIICRDQAIVMSQPGHRLIKGSFFALERAYEIHGQVMEVITEERRLRQERSTSLFARGMYILYLLQQKDDEGREIRPLTTVILDNDIIPSASITGENSIEGKVVLLDSDKITIMR